MSNPNSFRMNWREGDKALKEKPHIKLVLNAMKSNFNPVLKDLSKPTESDKTDINISKSNSSESLSEGKSVKKNSTSIISMSEPTKDQKNTIKSDSNAGKSNVSDLTLESKNTVKKTAVPNKTSTPDSSTNAKISSKKDSSVVKNCVTEPVVERKSISKKDFIGLKSNNEKIVNPSSIVKPEVVKKRTEKKLTEDGFGSCNLPVSFFGISLKEGHSVSKSASNEKKTATVESSVTAKSNMDRGKVEEFKKRMERKRVLPNRSPVSPKGGSDTDAQEPSRKRSARRWSKEGESVLQNAIARKEKSLSSIGISDDEKALKIASVRSSKEHKVRKRKSQDNIVLNSEVSPDPKARSPVLLKSPNDSSNDTSKEEVDAESSETKSEVSSKASSVKLDSETSYASHTKTGKRRHKPYRGLRYSFSGVTKRTKVVRCSAPSQRNISKGYHFNEKSSNLPSKSSTDSSLTKAANGAFSEKSRSYSPVVADACTSKSKKSRREDPLSPSPSPGDTPADANQPESTAISFGAGTAGLCLCQSKTSLYVRKDTSGENDVSLMCQAIDSLEGRLIGCCNAVGGMDSARLYRPSPRVPYVVLCEQHRQRLLRHHCCPGCGHYCTHGRFVQCPALHYYHRDCQLLIAGKPQCPHCGLDSPPDEVSISLGILKYPVFLPHQKLMKQTPSARMSLGSNLIPPGQPEPPPVGVAMTIPIATAPLLDKGEREKLEKLNGACSVRSEGRSAHLPRYAPKHLYQAAKAGDPEKVIAILRHGINPNHIFREINMRTALHAAAVRGHVLAVHVLVQAGAQLDPQDSDLMTPTMLASLHGHLRIVQYLVKAGACVTHQGSDGMTALHIAAKRGDLDTCHCLLSNGKAPLSYIDVKDDGGWTALVWSCEFRHSTVARYLLEKRADPLIRDNEENIALHWAAYSGSEEISERLLNYGCNINCLNFHGDSPLHVAARQDNIQCVLLFLSRGAKPDIVNRLGMQALDCAVEGGDCYNSIHTTTELRKMTNSAKERTNRILSNDITRGKEECEIQCLNAIDEESEPRDYVYVTENCFTSNIHVDRSITSLQSCNCEDFCIGVNCKCTQLSLQSWYDSEGKLLPEFNFFDPPMLFECNEMCACNVKLCKNRVVQRGYKVRFQLFRTLGKGWGVRTLTLIPKGTYVCEYIGEIISDCEADQREDDSYLFDLDNRDGETFCIDACRYGNIARFINHMCAPNLQPVRVFMGHHDLHFPRIAFFANRDIQPQEELGFDYGDKFWIIKYKSFTCTCGARTCKYSETTIKQTLADYNKKQEEESTS